VFVAHIGDLLQHAVVAELEVRRGQAWHRTFAIGHEGVHADGRYAGLEAGGLGHARNGRHHWRHRHDEE
jgi:hypothetical protein